MLSFDNGAVRDAFSAAVIAALIDATIMPLTTRGRSHDQAYPSAAPVRRDLPVVHRNQPVTITIGFFPGGDLGEVFISTGKSGADLQNIAHDAAVTDLRSPCSTASASKPSGTR